MDTNTPSSSDSSLPQSAWPTTSRRKPTNGKSARPRSPRPSMTRTSESGNRLKKPGKHRNRRQEILRRLDVDEDELNSGPKIAPLLKQNGIRPERLVEILRCDGSVESQSFVGQWDELTPASRSLIGIEAVALSCDISPRRLYELFCGAALTQSRESVGLTIALNLPDVMRTTVKEAKKAKGHYAREHLYKAAGVLPTPKGSVTNINVGKPEEKEENLDEDDFEDVEHADDFMMRASKAMSAKQLPAPEDNSDADA